MHATYLLTTQDYADRWHCNVKTIRRWMDQGAPLDDLDRHMLSWLGTRKHVPDGVYVRFAEIKKERGQCG